MTLKIQGIILILFLSHIPFFTCTDRERRNPLDPENSKTKGQIRDFRIASLEGKVQLSWQKVSLEGLDAILPWLLNVHVSAWQLPADGRPVERLPLIEGEAAWEILLPKIASSGRDCFAEIEFVQGDAPESFLRDAATLRRWLAHVNRTKHGGQE